MPRSLFKSDLFQVNKLGLLSSILITLILFNLRAASAHNNAPNPLLQKKSDLSRSLDSLDLLKQGKIREGRSYSEIELKQKQILDSLHFIRKKIQTDLSTSSPLSENTDGIPFLKYLKLSDWLLLISAVGALFYGILLLLGIIKKGIIHRPKTVTTNRSIKSNSSALDTETTGTSDAPADHQLDIITRETLKTHLQTINDEKNSDLLDESSDEDLETSVINAASNGMHIQEISRLFHISSDHVSLILRLSESKKNQ